MASLDEYAQWIVANKAKAGTPEFQTVSAAYRALKEGRIADLKKAGATGEAKNAGSVFTPSGESHPAGPQGLADLGYDPSSLGITPAENIAGHPLTRLAAGNPLTGLFRAGVKLAGGEQLAEHMSRADELEKTGREALGSTGYDFTKAAGSMVAPWGKFAPGAETSLAARAAYGAGEGAVGGLAAPGEDRADYGAHAGMGAMLGAALPVAGGVYKAAKAASDLVTPSGGSNIAGRWIRKIAGKDQSPALIQALDEAHNRVPNSEPTAAQAVAGISEGSPIQAAQKIIASIPGGISAQFDQRMRNQQAARSAALSRLGTTSNVERQQVAQALEEKLHNPVTKQYTPKKFLQAIQDDEDFTKSVTGISRNLQDLFPPSAYKKLMAVADETANDIATANPVQRTNLQGGVNIAEETRTKFPQFLSRPMMIANAVLGSGARGVEPRVESALAEAFLNPTALGQILRGPQASSLEKIIEAVVKQTGASAPGRLSVGPAAMAGQENQ